MKHRHKDQKAKDKWYEKRKARRKFEADALLSWKGGHTPRTGRPCVVTRRAPNGFKLNTRWQGYTEDSSAERRRGQIERGQLTVANGLVL